MNPNKLLIIEHQSILEAYRVVILLSLTKCIAASILFAGFSII